MCVEGEENEHDVKIDTRVRACSRIYNVNSENNTKKFLNQNVFSFTNTVNLLNPLQKSDLCSYKLPYIGKLAREKTFADE